MMHSRHIGVTPVTRIGDRFLLVITRQKAVHWDGGCIGDCIPLALVIVEGEECTVWQLDASLSREELRDVLAGMAEPFTGTTQIPGASL